jgi:hypothetical protein
MKRYLPGLISAVGVWRDVSQPLRQGNDTGMSYLCSGGSVSDEVQVLGPRCMAFTAD